MKYRTIEELRDAVDRMEAQDAANQKALAELQARVTAAEADRDDVQGVFDRTHAAHMRGIKAWQEANPGNDLVWPDTAKMVEWLLTRAAAAEKAADLSADLMRAAVRERDTLANAFGRISAALNHLDGKGDNTDHEDVIARIAMLLVKR